MLRASTVPQVTLGNNGVKAKSGHGGSGGGLCSDPSSGFGGGCSGGGFGFDRSGNFGGCRSGSGFGSNRSGGFCGVINAIRAQRFASTHDPLAQMANTQTPFQPDHSSLITYIQHLQPNTNFVPQPLFNTNYMQQPMQNPKDISDPPTAFDMVLEFMSKAFQLNNATPTNNNQRSSSIPCYNQIAKLSMNIDQDRQILMVDDNDIQNAGNQNGLSVVSRIANQHGNGNDAAYLQKQMQIAQKEEVRIKLTSEEFDFMAAEGAYDEIEKVTANYNLQDNLQQVSTSGTQSDKAPVYDSDGSAEYTELLKPIPEPHQIPHNDSNVISEVSSVKQDGGTVQQHLVNFEETRVLYDSLYNNLAIEVEKVNSVNHKLRETNVDLTTKLARYKS
uniref:Uncharacterized protein n=1 Tax=Tanacetum cinerariifolium TaxID=118510 RepID=A0A6L2N1C5_TANCI|nr:hypothetical protein [Tanacetum cinerariifolium]